MSQEFMVLKCFSCHMFQVHQVRKAKTWACKVCNAKQSQRKIYFKGSGKECRFNVQTLNMGKAKTEEHDEEAATEASFLSEKWPASETEPAKVKSEKKWSAFKASAEVDDEPSDVTSDDDAEMTKYDIVCVRKAATLDRNSWMGSKVKRRSRGAKSAKGEGTVASRYSDEENRTDAVPPMKKGKVDDKVDVHVSPIPRQKLITNSAGASKWSNYAIANGSSSDEDG